MRMRQCKKMVVEMACIDVVCLFVIAARQGSHKPGKPGIVREFCKPGKVREFAIWSGNFCIFRELLIYELIFACSV